MHLTWLLSTNFLLAMYALYLLWGAKEVLKPGLLGLCVVGTRDLYGGMLVDPDLLARHRGLFAVSRGGKPPR